MFFRDSDLPFEIAYHPDILRQEIGTNGSIQTFVYEIKPFIWYLRNRTYCDAQISGYAHFTGAEDALFVLYWQPQRNSEELALTALRARRIPWSELKAIALKSVGDLRTPTNG